MILTDGQCHYAFVVETEPGAQARVVAILNGWQAGVRAAGGFGAASLEDFCGRINAVPGVRSARPLGPRMAMPLALRMATGLTGITGLIFNQRRQPATLAGLQAMANWIHRASLHGIVNVPWVWPDASFTEDTMQPFVNR